MKLLFILTICFAFAVFGCDPNRRGAAIDCKNQTPAVRQYYPNPDPCVAYWLRKINETIDRNGSTTLSTSPTLRKANCGVYMPGSHWTQEEKKGSNCRTTCTPTPAIFGWSGEEGDVTILAIDDPSAECCLCAKADWPSPNSDDWNQIR